MINDFKQHRMKEFGIHTINAQQRWNEQSFVAEFED